MTTPPTSPSVQWPRESQRNFWRWICSPASRHPDSLFWYMKKIHGMDAFMSDNPTKQWFSRRIHLPYCRWKQNHYYRMFDAYKVGGACRVRLQTAVPRGWLKSTVSKGTLMWAHLENPGFATYLGSSDDLLAQRLFSSIPGIFKGQDSYAKFHLYYGNWFDPKRLSTKDMFVHAARTNTARQEPSFQVFSISTGFKGHHPDISVMDDPVDREKLRDEGSVHLQKANLSVVNARWAMPQCSVQEIVGSRYHDDDPQGHYQHLEGVRSWTGHPCWDPEVRILPNGEWDVFHVEARNPDDRESFAPEINTTDDLDKAEAANTVEFWNQMMNQPARGDHMGLDLSQLTEMWVSSESVKDIPGDYIICVDTAFKEDPQTVASDACESAFAIAKRDARVTKADYYVVECYTSRTDRIEDFTEKLVIKIQEYQAAGKRIYRITDERSPGKIGAWFHYLMNMCHAKGVMCPPTLELPRGGGKKSKKIRRLRVAAGFWADGRIKLVKGAPGVAKLASQMSRFEVTKIVDLADAAADLFHPDVYVVQAPSARSESLGVAQRGPDDDELMGEARGFNERQFNPDIIDTIFFNDDPWR